MRDNGVFTDNLKRRLNQAAVLSVSTVMILLSGCGSAGKASNEAGLASFEKEDYKKAEAYFRQAITQDNDEPEYYVN
ncbi:MAG: hypothetical protein IKN57_05365, partial [Parasporobacterium sp.]|nr:hypothetical protein [Parasporobacterium sp.]